MIKLEELRIKNIIIGDGRLIEITSISNSGVELFVDFEGEFKSYFEELEPVELTKEILRDNLGFSIHDMGDFWQCEKEDFVLVQPKLQLGEIEMPYIFVLKSSINGSVTFKYVHHLQNTYLDLKGELLPWKH